MRPPIPWPLRGEWIPMRNNNVFGVGHSWHFYIVLQKRSMTPARTGCCCCCGCCVVNDVLFGGVCISLYVCDIAFACLQKSMPHDIHTTGRDFQFINFCTRFIRMSMVLFIVRNYLSLGLEIKQKPERKKPKNSPRHVHDRKLQQNEFILPIFSLIWSLHIFICVCIECTISSRVWIHNF